MICFYLLIRYKLHLLVKDQTGESKFMLLDSVAKTIVKVSAEKLLNGSFDEVFIHLNDFLLCVLKFKFIFLILLLLDRRP